MRHRREYRFDRPLRAILRGGRSELLRQVEEGFAFLPAGCHMELDRVAARVVRENLRQSLPNRWAAKVEEFRGVLRYRGFLVTDAAAGAVTLAVAGRPLQTGRCALRVELESGATRYFEVGRRPSHRLARLIGSVVGGAAGAAAVGDVFGSAGEAIAKSSER